MTINYYTDNNLTATISANSVRQALAEYKARSAWKRGVVAYAADLLDNIDYESADDLHMHSNHALATALLNGASDWASYSYGGCALIYDSDIVDRLCTPSERKRCHGGKRNPNSRESWLDVQRRALSQACRLIIDLVHELAQA